MKKHYEPPKAEITEIENNDIIMVSGYTESLQAVDLGTIEIEFDVY